MKLVGKRSDKDYNIFYKKNKKVWGNEPAEILKDSITFLKDKKTFLDLGCGQGRNSFYMAKQGFGVEAIDFSNEAINQINDYALKNGITNIKARCDNILSLDMNLDFGIIGVINVVSLLERNIGLDFLKRLKSNMKKGTYLVLTGYLQDDIFYEDNKNGLFFKKKELLDLFSDFKVHIYKENTIIDEPHEGYEFKHTHSFCNLLAQKIIE